MTVWEIVGITAASILGALTLIYLTLAVYAATQLAHIARGELEPEDEGTE
jgi:hypothetical protein